LDEIENIVKTNPARGAFAFGYFFGGGEKKSVKKRPAESLIG